MGAESWEVQRSRIDAEWTPMYDENHRRVHGYALIEERPADLNGRTLVDRYSSRTFSMLPFSVRIYATRDGYSFGPLPPSTSYASMDAAIKHARSALAKQGSRYACKFRAVR
jgi:hypothetical protein